MKKIIKPKGERLLRKMFAENRRMMRDLNAINIGPSTSAGYLRKMRSNPRSGRSFRTKVIQIPAKSSRLNDQCFDFGERNRHSTEYPDTPDTKEISNCFRSTRGRQNIRDVRSAPYYVSTQSRALKKEWTEGSLSMRGEWDEGPPQSMTVSCVKEEPGLESRSIWKNNKTSTNSPWFPSGKNAESSYLNSQQESNSTPRYDNDSTLYSKPFSRRDMNRTSTPGKWGRSTTSSQDFDSYNDFDDFYRKESATKKWGTPPQRNTNLDDGEFYAKICDTVYEKVVQQLGLGTYQIDQKFVNSLSSPSYPKNGFSRYSSLKSSSMKVYQFPSEMSKRSDYPEYKASYFNPNRREYVSKPSFNQSFRGRGAGRVGKHKLFG